RCDRAASGSGGAPMTTLTRLKYLGARLRPSLGGHDYARHLRGELHAHVAMLTEDNLRRGMSPDEARRVALVRVGGVASIQEQHRGVRGVPSLEAILQDLRFAFRLIAKER